MIQVERKERTVRPAKPFMRLYVEDVDGVEVYRDRDGYVVDFEAVKASGCCYIAFSEFLRERGEL